jgi:5-methylcytosine-specific restriction protein A
VRNGVCSVCGPRSAPRLSQAQYDAQRGSSSERGYDVRWQRLRVAFLASHPYCNECARHGRVTLAQDVDHIVPLAQGGAVLDESNLQALCRACHNRKTRAQTGGAAPAGGHRIPGG